MGVVPVFPAIINFGETSAGDIIDKNYIEKWANELNLTDIWNMALTKTEQD